MSDKWLYYFCRMGDHYAFISYDDGVGETIDQIAPPQLLRLRLSFKHARENGFPSSEEFPELNALEEDLQDLTREHAALPPKRSTPEILRSMESHFPAHA